MIFRREKQTPSKQDRRLTGLWQWAWKQGTVATHGKAPWNGIPDWDTASDIRPSRRQARYIRKGKRKWAMQLIPATVAILVALFLLLYPQISQQADTVHQEQQSKMVEDSLPPLRKLSEKDMSKAEAYNRSLSRHPETTGEPVDPLSGNLQGDFAYRNDKNYWDTLNMGDGIMGTLRIPEIDVNLPIRHGADKQALDDGVGHLHGTSLPIGGPNTNSVLTGHRGLPNKLLFTRLDELKTGQPMYLHVNGKTLGYRIDHIWDMVQPTDMSHFSIKSGEDRLTLVTCTPFGINTHRLIVSGTRAGIPEQMPTQDKAPKDMRPARTAIITITVALTLIALYAYNRITRTLLTRHAKTSGRPPHHTLE